jgi:EAL domain-containing protein (putative c-di-GMP-specific phosphodiesterase class I)
VALDDFGTGLTSINSLRRLPVGTLKLDPSFIGHLDRDAVALVRAVATLAHTLGMEVAAEGIETDEQLAYLREAECDRGQGYFLSHPLTDEAMSQLLQQDLPLLAS